MIPTVTMRELKSSPIKKTHNFKQGYALHCPICGFDYLHFGGIEEVKGKDNYETGRGVRGDVLLLTFDGECEHHFKLAFGFHKGNIFCWYEDAGETDDPQA